MCAFNITPPTSTSTSTSSNAYSAQNTTATIDSNVLNYSTFARTRQPAVHSNAPPNTAERCARVNSWTGPVSSKCSGSHRGPCAVQPNKWACRSHLWRKASEKRDTNRAKFSNRTGMRPVTATMSRGRGCGTTRRHPSLLTHAHGVRPLMELVRRVPQTNGKRKCSLGPGPQRPGPAQPDPVLPTHFREVQCVQRRTFRPRGARC